ncbi:MAG: hypothetical protein ACRD4P_17645 [Bryobacteraceae bacterium]
MVWRILRKGGVIPLLLVLAAIGYWRLYPHPTKILSIGYVADRDVILWNSLAQVKQPITDLHYGNRVEVVRTEGTSMQVRTASGKIGWLLDSRQVMDEQLWGESDSLLARAKTLPVQAVGHTKTVSNLRIEPGRDAKRVYQFTRGVPVVVLERTVAEIPQASEENASETTGSAGPDQKPRQQEDWLLVMRATPATPNGSNTDSGRNPARSVSPASGDHVSGGPSQAGALSGGSSTTPIAGWVLARFIELDMPGPVRDNANNANLHVVAWFVLNRVPDGSGGEVPQYLVAGSRGGEGQPCDFTLLRVYTWSVARKRYETAYIESNLCGRLPIRVSEGGKGPEFQFADAGDAQADRKYVMEQTVVRLVKSESPGTSSAQRKTP